MAKSYRNIDAVKQIDETTCWAACLEWWLKAVENRTKLTQEDALQRYLQYWKDSADGSISKHGMSQIVYDADWRMEVQYQLAWNMSEETLLEHIARGPVYFGYYEKKVNGNHVNVVYGAIEKKSGLKLQVMEPDRGKHKIRTFSYYTNNIGDIVLASPKL